MNGDIPPVLLFPVYATAIPGVDISLARHLRARAEQCLEESEMTDGYIEDNPALIEAVLMDEVYEFSVQARMN